MGYNTEYCLEIKNHTDEDLDYLDFMLQKEDCAVTVNGESYGETKWYEHEEDLKKISTKFPGLILQLDGEGEESGDIWRKYFKDGKMQSANTKVEIIHEPFNEDLLEE